MCVILVGSVKAIRSLDLKSAWRDNPHGAGIAYVDRKRVSVKSGLMLASDLDRALASLTRFNGTIALHLRYATHGGRSRKNCHPFPVGTSGHYLMHNGVLENFGVSGDRGISDSMDLANTLGKIPKASDRQRILDNLNGMYAYIQPSGISLHGSRSWCDLEGDSTAGDSGRVYASNLGFTIQSRDYRVFEQGDLWNSM